MIAASSSGSCPSFAAILGSAAVDPPRRRFRLLESPRALAGFPSPAADYVEGALDLNELLVTNAPATFFVRASGRSQIDIGIFDGDILQVDRSVLPVNGRLVVAVVDGTLFVKEFRRAAERIALVSNNAAEACAYPPLYLDQAQEHAIWGCVVSVIRKLR